MYRYETHLHTSPVSKCARADVERTLAFYSALGYDGVFITNHFLDGNVNIEADRPYPERIEFYFSDYEAAAARADDYGLKVFPGVELSYLGTDFLVYGLDKAWYLMHPEIMEMRKSEELPYLMSQGALIVQAHPFREDWYIDHIRLFPRCVQGVEIHNAERKPLENDMAALYAKAYGLVPLAGSDNHRAEEALHLGGIEVDTPIVSVGDFISRVLARQVRCFAAERSSIEEDFSYRILETGDI